MENTNSKVEVVIGGKIYKLSGQDSPDYIQTVARYIDAKLSDLKRAATPSIVYDDSFPIILALNIADDLFKERENKVSSISEGSEGYNDRLMVQAREMTELKNQLASKTNDYKLLLDQFESKSSEVDGLKTNIINKEDKIEALEKKQEEIKAALEEANGRIEEKSQYITNLNAKISDKNQELNSLSKKLAEKNNALNELNKKSADRNIKLNNVNKERDDLAIKLKSANSSIRNLESNAQKAAEAMDKMTAERNDYKAKYELLQEQFEVYKKSLEMSNETQLKAAFAKIKAENLELTRKAEALEAQLSKK